MRLLLDEMYPAVLAEQLRGRGHDVAAVTERPELRSLADVDVFQVCQGERRAIVTENIGDFVRIAEVVDQGGAAHYGLLFIDPAKFPRGRQRTIGRLVTGLDHYLRKHPQDRASSLRHWL